MPLEEGKDPNLTRITQSRVFPFRLLQFLVLFIILGIGFSILSLYMIKHFGVENVVNTTQFSFQPCLEDPSNLDHWIKPPSNLIHKMSDEELFWRASFVPRVRNYPFKRVPKIAFMFLTRGPLPLAPLWERFLKDHQGFYSIYIHSLPSYDDADFLPTSVFYKRQIPSQITEWGKISLIDAERRLLANALLDFSNERFILVSESCVPLYNFSILYSYLMQSNHSFIQAIDDPGRYGRGRYNESMAPEITLAQWRKGSQWFEVNRKLAVNIVQDTSFYLNFQLSCKPDCYVDEHYFPTMLTIQAAEFISNRSITWVDWSRGGAHPARFGKADITEEFFKKIIEGKSCTYNNQNTTICYLFARKFAPSALEPLLELAPKLLGF